MNLQKMLTERHHIDTNTAEEMVRLLKMKYWVLKGDERESFLKSEIENALHSLAEDEDTAYVKAFRHHFQWIIWRHKWKSKLGIHINKNHTPRIALFSGFISYIILVFLAGMAATVVYSLNQHPEWGTSSDFNSAGGLVQFTFELGLLPIFQFAQAYISPEAFMIGLMGGAGATVSLIKRLDEITKAQNGFWFFWGKGLLNPITGSIVALVLSQVLIFDAVAKTVIAFFAGFSERLLDKIEKKLMDNY